MLFLWQTVLPPSPPSAHQNYSSDSGFSPNTTFCLKTLLISLFPPHLILLYMGFFFQFYYENFQTYPKVESLVLWTPMYSSPSFSSYPDSATLRYLLPLFPGLTYVKANPGHHVLLPCVCRNARQKTRHGVTRPWRRSLARENSDFSFSVASYLLRNWIFLIDFQMPFHTWFVWIRTQTRSELSFGCYIQGSAEVRPAWVWLVG